MTTKRYAVYANLPPPGATVVNPQQQWPMRVVSESKKPLGAALRSFAFSLRHQSEPGDLPRKVYIYDRWSNARTWAPSYISDEPKLQCKHFMRFLRQVKAWHETYQGYRAPLKDSPRPSDDQMVCPDGFSRPRALAMELWKAARP